MIAAALPIRVILYIGPPSEPIGAAPRAAMISRLLERGISVRIVCDDSSLLSVTDRAGHERSIVLGNFCGRIPATIRGDVRDVCGLEPDDVVAMVEDRSAGPASAPAPRWKPWFPVIDFSRCTNCMQCLSFCLFDVYGVTSDGRIQVQNESNCKTDCPACSRVCPEVAIMFPKYKAGPINGDEISSEDVRREAMKVDISALLGGDIYSMLRDRSAKAKSRFSKERDDERALKERQRCLDKLKGAVADFEIPPEVLASLPSAEQIQKNAERARNRAAEALKMRSPAQTSVADIPSGAQVGGNA
jgi:NAD-dependent dihydropyrimidine dehydrogenase PreA subunit